MVGHNTDAQEHILYVWVQTTLSIDSSIQYVSECSAQYCNIGMNAFVKVKGLSSAGVCRNLSSIVLRIGYKTFNPISSVNIIEDAGGSKKLLYVKLNYTNRPPPGVVIMCKSAFHKRKKSAIFCFFLKAESL